MSEQLLDKNYNRKMKESSPTQKSFLDINIIHRSTNYKQEPNNNNIKKKKKQINITMLDPIPQKVKDCLGELTPAQQVILRGYIGTLRAELKEKDGEILGLRDGEPNAHYHGDTACTADQYVYIYVYI